MTQVHEIQTALMTVGNDNEKSSLDLRAAYHVCECVRQCDIQYMQINKCTCAMPCVCSIPDHTTDATSAMYL